MFLFSYRSLAFFPLVFAIHSQPLAAQDTPAAEAKVTLTVSTSGDSTGIQVRGAGDPSRVILLQSDGEASVSATLQIPRDTSDTWVSYSKFEGQGAGVAVSTKSSLSASWSATYGGLSPASEDSVFWFSDGSGEPSVISVTVGSEVSSSDSQETRSSRSFMGKNAVTLLPAVEFDRTGDGTIDGVMVGIYPNERSYSAPGPVSRNVRAYRPPQEFYRIDESTKNLSVAEGLTLGELAPSVFEDVDVRFVSIDPSLVQFWATLRSTTESSSLSPNSLRILRGFVSPHERRRLEQLGVELAEFTRFQYGDALGIIYDADNDFRMDDLTGDGISDSSDSEFLANLAQEAMNQASLRGGIGTASSFAGPNHIGTPYLHVDLRGWNQRWRE